MVTLDVDTLPTVPDAPPEAGPDRALDPPPPAAPLPGRRCPEVPEGDPAVADGDVAEVDVVVAEATASAPPAIPPASSSPTAPVASRCLRRRAVVALVSIMSSFFTITCRGDRSMTNTMPTDSGVSFWRTSRVAVCFSLVHKVTGAIQKRPTVAQAGGARRTHGPQAARHLVHSVGAMVMEVVRRSCCRQ